MIKHLQYDPPHYLTEPLGLDDPLPEKLRFSALPGPIEQRHGTVTIIPRARVCLSRTNVITEDNKLVWNLSPEKGKAMEDHSIFLRDHLPPVQSRVHTLVLLANEVGGAYFHWMLDVLPCLYLIRQCGIKPDKYVISGKCVEPFQFETLERLGVPRTDIVVSDDQLHLEAQLLVIPKMSKGLRPKWGCDFLKRELMERKSIRPRSGCERIYISRAKAKRRKVINESEVTNELSKYGFQTVNLEDFTVGEQIEMFSSARIVAGPHGSGFTNVLFSNPGIQVLEFFSWSFIHNCYPLLSSILGHKHYYLSGDTTGLHQSKGDIIVNMEKLARLLKLARINPL